jgi:choline dehydrogenase-like flavoprotein
MRDHGASTIELLLHLRNVIRDPIRLASFAGGWIRARSLAARKLPSVMLYSPAGRYPLEFHAEQECNRDSRVTLAATRDRHGLQQMKVDWRTTPLDLRTICEAYKTLGDELARTGTGRIELTGGRIEDLVKKAGAYGGHHIGTTRMAASPRNGVVDPNCRVHGVMNLYVAGSSVFPTSGQANPTLTILALAFRLAERLAAL